MILDIGLIDYSDALKLQRELVNKRRLNQIKDSILILEHPPVYTIGRSGSRDNLLVKEESLTEKGINILDVDRGGDITFHGPGQLVAYPIIDLKNRNKDLHAYLRDLEEAAILFLKKYTVTGQRIEGATGVWVKEKKIVSVGIAAKDWVTYHGLSININNDLKFFSMINPCGMKNIKITSLKDILGAEIPMYEAKKMLLAEFKHIFGFKDMENVNEYSASVA